MLRYSRVASCRRVMCQVQKSRAQFFGNIDANDSVYGVFSAGKTTFIFGVRRRFTMLLCLTNSNTRTLSMVIWEISAAIMFAMEPKSWSANL